MPFALIALVPWPLYASIQGTSVHPDDAGTPNTNRSFHQSARLGQEDRFTMQLDLNAVTETAAAAREDELRVGLGGPLLDLKEFFEGDTSHHIKMAVADKLQELLRNPASIVTLATEANGHQARMLGGSPDEVVDTPEVAQLIALARLHPDRAGFMATIVEQFSQLAPDVARITAQLTSKVAQREGDWTAIPHPGTGEPTTQRLLDLEQRVRELERERDAAVHAIEDIAGKAGILEAGIDMGGYIARSTGPVDIEARDGQTVRDGLQALKTAIDNAAGPAPSARPNRNRAGRTTR